MTQFCSVRAAVRPQGWDFGCKVPVGLGLGSGSGAGLGLGGSGSGSG